MAPEIEFNRRAVRPVECLREGWRLIKKDYWLFLGISFVGLLIGSAAPLGLLAGPMMCGIEICLLRRMNGQRVSFDMLFRGFDYFVPGLIVSLVMTAPVLVLLVLYYVGIFASFAAFLPAMQQGGPPDATAIGIFVGLQFALAFAFVAVLTMVSALFLFTYPLIVEHELSGMQAIGLSIKAVLANLGGIVGLMFLWTLVSLAGVLACYVGAILVLPIYFAAVSVAYRQVFPMELAPARASDGERVDEDLPPVVSLSNEGIQNRPDERVATEPAPPPAPSGSDRPSSTDIQGDPTRQGPPV